MSYRQRMNYPPFYRLARILYQCSDINLMEQEMAILSEKTYVIISSFKPQQIYLLGPTPAPFARMNNLFRWHIIIKGLTPAIINKAISEISKCHILPASMQVQIDVDPFSLM